MLIAVLILSVVVLIEAYIIVEREGRIRYLRKRLLKQIRMNDSMKMKLQLQNQKVWVVEKPDITGAEKVIDDFKKTHAYEQMKNLIVHPSWGQMTSEELLEYLNGIKGFNVEVGGMPIEMTEVKRLDTKV